MPNPMIEFISTYINLSIIAGLAAFFLSSSIYLYPVIINVSKIKGLMDDPDHRKMHITKTPNLGGLGIFLAFSLSMIVFGVLTHLELADLSKLLTLLGSSIILVFLGIKDDLTGMAPKKKFIGQLIAVLNVVVLTDIRILNFGGIFGIYELPYFVSILFSIFVFMLVINAFNLVDGIDGLAGSLSILGSIIFGLLFSLKGNYFMSLISAIIIGSVLGFLKFNLSRDKKIFMGDCGSLLTGFLLAYQGICFLNLYMENGLESNFSNTPVILLSILSYPLFDLLRVFTIRIKEGKSPFSADSNHIHHRLLRLGLTHKNATLSLIVANFLVITFAFLTMGWNIHVHLILSVLFGVSIYLIPFLEIFNPKLQNGTKYSGKKEINVNGNEKLIASEIKNTFQSHQNDHLESSVENNQIGTNGFRNRTSKKILRNRIKNVYVLKEKLKNKKGKVLDTDSVLDK